MTENILQDRSADYASKPLPAIPADYTVKEDQDMIIVEYEDADADEDAKYKDPAT